MLKDARVRGLATEFAGNWLDFRRFEEHNSVDRGRFPSFNDELRQAMFEEPIRFFMGVTERDRSVLDFLYAKDTLVNPVLARHYGVPPPAAGGGDTNKGRGPPGRGRAAADGGVPDEERSRPADQPGEARLLGRPPTARRADPRPARRGARAAHRRGE